MALALVALLLVRTLAVTCPKVTCQPLDLGVCALKLSLTEVALNSHPAADMFCPASELFQWFPSANVSSTLPSFSSASVTGVDYSSHSSWSCYVRNPLKELLVSQPPKQCTRDADCTLRDYSKASCQCSLQSDSTKGICQADINSQVFEEYWRLCGSTGVIREAEKGAYWEMYARYYSLVEGRVECADRAVEEVKAVLWAKQLAEEAGGVAGMKVAIVLALMIDL